MTDDRKDVSEIERELAEMKEQLDDILGDEEDDQDLKTPADEEEDR